VGLVFSWWLGSDPAFPGLLLLNPIAQLSGNVLLVRLLQVALVVQGLFTCCMSYVCHVCFDHFNTPQNRPATGVVL
jgi:hypothetical protein